MTYTKLTLALVIVFLNIYYVISLRNEKILGGAYVEPDKFPYHAAINRPGNICGGGILTENFIVTAAHCVIGSDNEFVKKSLTVIVGTTDIYGTDGIVIPVKKIFVPNEYDLKKRSSDIALLQLQKSLDLSDKSKLKKLKLPTEENYFNKTAVITGFGLQWRNITDSNSFFLPPIITSEGRDGKLKYLQVDTVEREECQPYYAVSPLFFWIDSVNIDETHICSLTKNVSEPQGICNGDSGGPLVTNDDTIIGVAIFTTLSCDGRQIPAVYTRIWPFIPFFHNVWSENYQNVRVFEFNSTMSPS